MSQRHMLRRIDGFVDLSEVRAHLAPATHQRFFLPQIVMGSDIRQFILDPRDCLSQLQNAS
jgi:hypothetical protein